MHLLKREISVVVHFSCHGHQIEDDNNDEIDGLDEAIVPYGAVASYDERKFKELFAGYLRDDLIWRKNYTIKK